MALRRSSSSRRPKALPSSHYRHEIAGLRRLIDHERCRRRGDGDEPCAGTAGAKCGQPRRTSGDLARQHGGMAACILVIAAIGALQMVSPQRRRVQQRRGAISRNTPEGMPMSATSSAPHRAILRANSGPGLARKNVTVRAAVGARPMISPLSPCSPLGTSMATVVSASLC